MEKFPRGLKGMIQLRTKGIIQLKTEGNYSVED
jgi:hypothetical protein